MKSTITTASTRNYSHRIKILGLKKYAKMQLTKCPNHFFENCNKFCREPDVSDSYNRGNSCSVRIYPCCLLPLPPFRDESAPALYSVLLWRINRAVPTCQASVPPDPRLHTEVRSYPVNTALSTEIFLHICPASSRTEKFILLKSIPEKTSRRAGSHFDDQLFS